MNMSAAVDEAIAPKVLPGSKELQVVCSTCTFINAADAKVCEMCGAEVKPPTHDVQANGMWKCGGCATMNRKGAKECVRCHVPLYSVVTSAAPSQIFCPHCGFLNDGGNAQCVQCDATIRSTLAKLSTDLRDSTNFIARDMGVNIHVKCPGCATVCFVPPATACLRCGTCHTYFASPSVGDATNFHMARLASSISSSFMGLFAQKQRAADATAASQDDAPEGKLIALGDKLPRSPLRAGRTRSNSASFRSSSSSTSSANAPLTSREQRALEETERAQAFARQEQALENMHTASYAQSAVPPPAAALAPDAPFVATALPPSAAAVTVPRSRRRSSSSSRAASLAHPVAPQDLVKVEGEIVEL